MCAATKTLKQKVATGSLSVAMFEDRSVGINAGGGVP
jgi:hypothetical protein